MFLFLPYSDITALAKDRAYTHINLNEMTIHQVTTENLLFIFWTKFLTEWSSPYLLYFKWKSKCWLVIYFCPFGNVAIDDFALNTRLLRKILHFWNWLLIIKKSGGVIFLALFFGIFHQSIKKIRFEICCVKDDVMKICLSICFFFFPFGAKYFSRHFVYEAIIFFFAFLTLCRHYNWDKIRIILMNLRVRDVRCACVLIHCIKWWSAWQIQVTSSFLFHACFRKPVILFEH